MSDNENGFDPLENIENSEKPDGTSGNEDTGHSFNEDYRSKYDHYNDFFTNREEPPAQNVNGEYSVPHPQHARNDFSRYNDTVNDIPKVDAEPVYSPYSARPAGEKPTAETVHSDTDDSGRNEKSKKGFKVFIAVVLAVAVAVVAILFVYSKKPAASSDSKKNTDSVNDNVTLNIADTPEAKEKTNAEQIATKAQKFNVGILLYGKTSSFTSSSANPAGSLVGEGSGIIMNQEGEYTFILTCAHVISGVKSNGYTMTVQDCNGKHYDGTVVGLDTKTDIGVIKIKATGLTCAEFGDSSNLVIGQQVYAIGNPGGVEFFGSFTNGMISAIDRPINSEGGYEMNCIQHTTPINSGNSGGALLNEYGQVIGINSSKIVSTGYEGMAFSIPISDAKPIIDDLIANGHVSNRAKIGITYAPCSAYSQYQMIVSLKELPSGSLIIAKINPDSDLNNTDAQVGDMIIAVDGEDMKNADVLLKKVENGKVGDTLKLTLCRIGNDYKIKTFDVSIKLVEDDGTGSETEQTTTTANDFYNYFFGNGGW